MDLPPSDSLREPRSKLEQYLEVRSRIAGTSIASAQQSGGWEADLAALPVNQTSLDTLSESHRTLTNLGDATAARRVRERAGEILLARVNQMLEEGETGILAAGSLLAQAADYGPAFNDPSWAPRYRAVRTRIGSLLVAQLAQWQAQKNWEAMTRRMDTTLTYQDVLNEADSNTLTKIQSNTQTYQTARASELEGTNALTNSRYDEAVQHLRKGQQLYLTLQMNADADRLAAPLADAEAGAAREKRAAERRALAQQLSDARTEISDSSTLTSQQAKQLDERIARLRKEAQTRFPEDTDLAQQGVLADRELREQIKASVEKLNRNLREKRVSDTDAHF